jgi:hypothetical protein
VDRSPFAASREWCREGEFPALSAVGALDPLERSYQSHLSAFTFEQVMKQVKARYILGLTATLSAKTDTTRSSTCSAVRYDISSAHVR